MAFNKNFNVGERRSTGPAGSFHPGIYVDTAEIEGLIESLEPYIPIDKSQSKKVYSYGAIGLEEYSPSVKRPKGYILKGGSLEIRLENQRSLKLDSRKSRTDNNCERITSIKCEVFSPSENQIGELRIQEIADKIRDFYNNLPNEKPIL